MKNSSVKSPNSESGMPSGSISFAKPILLPSSRKMVAMCSDGMGSSNSPRLVRSSKMRVRARRPAATRFANASRSVGLRHGPAGRGCSAIRQAAPRISL